MAIRDESLFHFAPSKGVYKMQSGLLTFSTVTYAMKAQSLLQRSGIRAEIQKTQDRQRNGCQYTIRINARFTTAVELLDKMNIPYQNALKDDGV